MPVDSTQLAAAYKSASAVVESQGDVATLLWWALGVLGSAFSVVVTKLWFTVEGRDKLIDDAVDKARADWERGVIAAQGVTSALQQELKQNYATQITALHTQADKLQTQLADINRDLRSQEGKSIEVLGQVAEKLRIVANGLTTIHSRIYALEVAMSRLPGANIVPSPPTNDAIL